MTIKILLVLLIWSIIGHGFWWKAYSDRTATTVKCVEVLSECAGMLLGEESNQSINRREYDRTKKGI